MPRGFVIVIININNSIICICSYKKRIRRGRLPYNYVLKLVFSFLDSNSIYKVLVNKRPY